MTPTAKSPYAGYRFPGEVISHAVWLYFRFPLSLRMVEEMLAARGIDVSHEGTVNLIGSGRDKAHEGRSHEGLCPSGHAGDLGPGLEGLGSGGSILDGRAVIAAEMEQVVDLIVSGEEALGLVS